MFAPRTRRFMHAHAHADNAPLFYARVMHAHVMATFGEEISAEACSGKEIAGLLRKMIMMMNMMTREIT